MKSLLILTVFIILVNISNIRAETHFLEPGDKHTVDKSAKNALQIFCYKGRPKYIIHIWHSVSMELEHKSDNYLHYYSESPEQVQEKYYAQHSSWSFNLFSWKLKRFKLDPFAQTCIGIESNESYSVSLQVIRIDYWKVILLLSGVVLFFYSPILSGNAVFYYLCGIVIGISASFLILIYFISKLFPKKTMMYGFVAGGWTVGVYLIQMLWENLQIVLTVYNKYVLWYMFLSGVISFVVCYYWGPLRSDRSKNILKWALQAISFVLVFYSSHFQEAAMAIIVLLILAHNIPKSWILKSRYYWKRKFAPKRRLLTNDEYYQQGIHETTKALEELRSYCSSPECNQWSTVLKLQDAKRFAAFMEGKSHLTDEEILYHDNESMDPREMTDDEEYLTDDSSDEPIYLD